MAPSFPCRCSACSALPPYFKLVSRSTLQRHRAADSENGVNVRPPPVSQQVLHEAVTHRTMANEQLAALMTERFPTSHHSHIEGSSNRAAAATTGAENSHQNMQPPEVRMQDLSHRIEDEHFEEEGEQEVQLPHQDDVLPQAHEEDDWMPQGEGDLPQEEDVQSHEESVLPQEDDDLPHFVPMREDIDDIDTRLESEDEEEAYVFESSATGTGNADVTLWKLELLHRITIFMSMLDEFHVSRASQVRLLQFMFEDKGSLPHQGSFVRFIAMLGQQKLDSILSSWQPPTTKEKVNAMYKELGLPPTLRWRMCSGNMEFHEPAVLPPSHQEIFRGRSAVYCSCPGVGRVLQRNCQTCSEKCPESTCGRLRKEMLTFDYLPLHFQLREIVKSRTFGYNILQIWRERSSWLGRGPNEVLDSYQECWHGSKIRLYQDFLTPGKAFELPLKCPSCSRYYKLFPESMKDGAVKWNATMQKYDFSCVNCHGRIVASKAYGNGDPRNLLLMSHWDGFQMATTALRSSAVASVVILNTGKRRSFGLMPFLFLPFSSTNILTSGSGKEMTAFQSFMVPFIQESLDIMVNGFDVHFAYLPKSLAQQGLTRRFKMRVMLDMACGDHPAQCHVGLHKQSGKHPCRRDHVTTNQQGKLDRNRMLVFAKPSVKNCARLASVAEKYDPTNPSRETSERLKKRELDEVGLSGVSKFWPLFFAFGFDLCLDLPYDVMHSLALNLFKNFVELLIEKQTMETLQAWDFYIKVVRKHRNSEQTTGRWPKEISPGVPFWKAEDYLNFVQWVLPYILVRSSGTMSHDLVVISQLVIDLSHLFFAYSREHSWSPESIHVARTLFSRWRILCEEYFGPNARPLEHASGNGELLDDILRHGMHDTYWCFQFEREVSKILCVKLNNKLNEQTFIRHYGRRVFAKVFSQIQMDRDGLLPPQRTCKLLRANMVCPEGTDVSLKDACCRDLRSWTISVRSIRSAKTMWDAAILVRMHHCSSLVQDKGILIQPKNLKFRNISTVERLFFRRYWNLGQTDPINRMCVLCNSVLFKNMLIRKGENVLIFNTAARQAGAPMELAEVLEVFTHTSMGDCHVFLKVTLLEPFISQDAQLMETVSNLGMRLCRNSSRTEVTALFQIHSKFMRYPSGYDQDCSFTFDRSTLMKPAIVPPYPLETNVVMVENGGRNRIAVVTASRDDYPRAHEVKVDWLFKVNEDNVWAREETDDNSYLVSTVVAKLDGWKQIPGTDDSPNLWQAEEVPDGF